MDQLALDTHNMKVANQAMETELATLKIDYAALKEKHDTLSTESSRTIEGMYIVFPQMTTHRVCVYTCAGVYTCACVFDLLPSPIFFFFAFSPDLLWGPRNLLARFTRGGLEICWPG